MRILPEQRLGGKPHCAGRPSGSWPFTDVRDTEPGWNMHTAAEIGIDDFQSSRSPDGMYRTTPLRGLFTRTRGGFYHDGRFATLADVVTHYSDALSLDIPADEQSDLVAYLQSL